MFLIYVVFCFLVFGCQYQGNQLPGKTRLRNDPLIPLCVEWGVKPYALTVKLILPVIIPRYCIFVKLVFRASLLLGAVWSACYLMR